MEVVVLSPRPLYPQGVGTPAINWIGYWIGRSAEWSVCSRRIELRKHGRPTQCLVTTMNGLNFVYKKNDI